jgi:hypothetical protein
MIYPDWAEPAIDCQINPICNKHQHNVRDRDDLRGSSWWMGQARLYAQQKQQQQQENNENNSVK